MTEQVPAVLEPLVEHLQQWLEVRKAVTLIARDFRDAAQHLATPAQQPPEPDERHLDAAAERFAAELAEPVKRWRAMLPSYERRLAVVDTDVRALVDALRADSLGDDRLVVAETLDAVMKLGYTVAGLSLLPDLDAVEQRLGLPDVGTPSAVTESFALIRRTEAADALVRDWGPLVTSAPRGT